MLRSENELNKPSFSRLRSGSSSGRISKKHIARRKEFLRFINNGEYNSYISVSIAEKLLREINEVASYNEQTPEFVNEIRDKLFLLHEYNTHVAKIAYTYPTSKEIYELLGRYVALEYDVLYKNEHKFKYEIQVENRVFRTITTFLKNSYSAEDNSLGEERNDIYNEALKIFVSYVDVKYTSDEEKFPARIVKNILDILGVIKKSPTNSSLHLDLTNPSLIRLKESLRDSDYGSDDDGQESASLSSESSYRTFTLRNNEVKKEPSDNAINSSDSTSVTVIDDTESHPSTNNSRIIEPIKTRNVKIESSQSSSQNKRCTEQNSSGLKSVCNSSNSQPVPNFPSSNEVFSSIRKDDIVSFVELNVDEDIEVIKWSQRKSKNPQPWLERRKIPNAITNNTPSVRKEKGLQGVIKQDGEENVRNIEQCDTNSNSSRQDGEEDFNYSLTNFDDIREKLAEQRRKNVFLSDLCNESQQKIFHNAERTSSTTAYTSVTSSVCTGQAIIPDGNITNNTFSQSDIVIDITSSDEDEPANKDCVQESTSGNHRRFMETLSNVESFIKEEPKTSNEINELCNENKTKENFPPASRGKIFCRSIDQLTNNKNCVRPGKKTHRSNIFEELDAGNISKERRKKAECLSSTRNISSTNFEISASNLTVSEPISSYNSAVSDGIKKEREDESSRNEEDFNYSLTNFDQVLAMLEEQRRKHELLGNLNNEPQLRLLENVNKTSFNTLNIGKSVTTSRKESSMCSEQVHSRRENTEANVTRNLDSAKSNKQSKLGWFRRNENNINGIVDIILSDDDEPISNSNCKVQTKEQETFLDSKSSIPLACSTPEIQAQHSEILNENNAEQVGSSNATVPERISTTDMGFNSTFMNNKSQQSTLKNINETCSTTFNTNNSTFAIKGESLSICSDKVIVPKKEIIEWNINRNLDSEKPNRQPEIFIDITSSDEDEPVERKNENSIQKPVIYSNAMMPESTTITEDLKYTDATLKEVDALNKEKDQKAMLIKSIDVNTYEQDQVTQRTTNASVKEETCEDQSNALKKLSTNSTWSNDFIEIEDDSEDYDCTITGFSSKSIVKKEIDENKMSMEGHVSPSNNQEPLLDKENEIILSQPEVSSSSSIFSTEGANSVVTMDIDKEVPKASTNPEFHDVDENILRSAEHDDKISFDNKTVSEQDATTKSCLDASIQETSMKNENQTKNFSNERITTETSLPGKCRVIDSQVRASNQLPRTEINDIIEIIDCEEYECMATASTTESIVVKNELLMDMSIKDCVSPSKNHEESSQQQENTNSAVTIENSEQALEVLPNQKVSIDENDLKAAVDFPPVSSSSTVKQVDITIPEFISADDWNCTESTSERVDRLKDNIPINSLETSFDNNTNERDAVKKHSSDATIQEKPVVGESGASTMKISSNESIAKETFLVDNCFPKVSQKTELNQSLRTETSSGSVSVGIETEKLIDDSNMTIGCELRSDNHEGSLPAQENQNTLEPLEVNSSSSSVVTIENDKEITEVSTNLDIDENVSNPKVVILTSVSSSLPVRQDASSPENVTETELKSSTEIEPVITEFIHQEIYSVSSTTELKTSESGQKKDIDISSDDIQLEKERTNIHEDKQHLTSSEEAVKNSNDVEQIAESELDVTSLPSAKDEGSKAETDILSDADEKKVIDIINCPERQESRNENESLNLNIHTTTAVELDFENANVELLENTQPKFSTATVTLASQEIGESYSESFTSCFTHKDDIIIEVPFSENELEKDSLEKIKKLKQKEETSEKSIKTVTEDAIGESKNFSPLDFEKSQAVGSNQTPEVIAYSVDENVDLENEFLDSNTLYICSEQEIETHEQEYGEVVESRKDLSASSVDTENCSVDKCCAVSTVGDVYQPSEEFANQDEPFPHNSATDVSTIQNISKSEFVEDQVVEIEIESDSNYCETPAIDFQCVENVAIEVPSIDVHSKVDHESLDAASHGSIKISLESLSTGRSEETVTNSSLIKESELEISSLEKRVVINETEGVEEKDSKKGQEFTNIIDKSGITDIPQEKSQKDICVMENIDTLTDNTEIILYDDECSSSYIIDESEVHEHADNIKEKFEVDFQTAGIHDSLKKHHLTSGTVTDMAANSNVTDSEVITSTISKQTALEQSNDVSSDQAITDIQIPSEGEKFNIEKLSSKSTDENILQKQQCYSDSPTRIPTTLHDIPQKNRIEETPLSVGSKLEKLETTPKRPKSKCSDSHNVVGNLGKMMLLMSNTEPRRPKRNISFTSPIKMAETCLKFDTSPTTQNNTMIDTKARECTYTSYTTDTETNSSLNVTSIPPAFSDTTLYPPTTFYSSFIPNENRDNEVLNNIKECDFQKQQLDIDILASVASNQKPLKVDAQQQKCPLVNRTKSPKSKKLMKTVKSPSTETALDTSVPSDAPPATPKSKLKYPKRNSKSPKSDNRKDSNPTKSTPGRKPRAVKNVEDKLPDKTNKEEIKTKKNDKRQSRTTSKDKKISKIVKTTEKTSRLNQVVSSDSDDSLPLNIRMKKCEVSPVEIADTSRSNKKENTQKSSKTKVSKGRGKTKEQNNTKSKVKTSVEKKLVIDCSRERENDTKTENTLNNLEKSDPKVTSPDQTKRIVHFKKAILESISLDLDETNRKISITNELTEISKPLTLHDNIEIGRNDLLNEKNRSIFNVDASTDSLPNTTYIKEEQLNNSKTETVSQPNHPYIEESHLNPRNNTTNFGVNLNVYISPLVNTETNEQRINDEMIETSIELLEKDIKMSPETLATEKISPESATISVTTSEESINSEEKLVIPTGVKTNIEGVVRKHRKKELLETQRCIEELKNNEQEEHPKGIIEPEHSALQSHNTTHIYEQIPEKISITEYSSFNVQEKSGLDETPNSSNGNMVSSGLLGIQDGQESEKTKEQVSELQSGNDKVGQTECKKTIEETPEIQTERFDDSLGNKNEKKIKRISTQSTELKVSLIIPDIDSILKNKMNRDDNCSQRSLRSNSSAISKPYSSKNKNQSKTSGKVKNLKVEEDSVAKKEENSTVSSSEISVFCIANEEDNNSLKHPSKKWGVRKNKQHVPISSTCNKMVNETDIRKNKKTRKLYDVKHDPSELKYPSETSEKTSIPMEDNIDPFNAPRFEPKIDEMKNLEIKKKNPYILLEKLPTLDKDDKEKSKENLRRSKRKRSESEKSEKSFKYNEEIDHNTIIEKTPKSESGDVEGVDFKRGRRKSRSGKTREVKEEKMMSPVQEKSVIDEDHPINSVTTEDIQQAKKQNHEKTPCAEDQTRNQEKLNLTSDCVENRAELDTNIMSTDKNTDANSEKKDPSHDNLSEKEQINQVDILKSGNENATAEIEEIINEHSVPVEIVSEEKEDEERKEPSSNLAEEVVFNEEHRVSNSEEIISEDQIVKNDDKVITDEEIHVFSEPFPYDNKKKLSLSPENIVSESEEAIKQKTIGYTVETNEVSCSHKASNSFKEINQDSELNVRNDVQKSLEIGASSITGNENEPKDCSNIKASVISDSCNSQENIIIELEEAINLIENKNISKSEQQYEKTEVITMGESAKTEKITEFTVETTEIGASSDLCKVISQNTKHANENPENSAIEKLKSVNDPDVADKISEENGIINDNFAVNNIIEIELEISEQDFSIENKEASANESKVIVNKSVDPNNASLENIADDNSSMDDKDLVSSKSINLDDSSVDGIIETEVEISEQGFSTDNEEKKNNLEVMINTDDTPEKTESHDLTNNESLDLNVLSPQNKENEKSVQLIGEEDLVCSKNIEINDTLLVDESFNENDLNEPTLNIYNSSDQEKKDDTTKVEFSEEPKLAVEITDLKSPKNKRKQREEQENVEEFIKPKKCRIQIIQNEIIRPPNSVSLRNEENKIGTEATNENEETIKLQVSDEVSLEQDVPNVSQSEEVESSENLQHTETLVENSIEIEAVDREEDYIEVQVAGEVSIEQDLPNVSQSVEDDQRIISEDSQPKETLGEINMEIETVDNKDEYIELTVANEVSIEQDVPNITQSLKDNQRVSSDNIQFEETLLENNIEIEAVDKKEEYFEVQVADEISLEQDVPNVTKSLEDYQRLSSENIQLKETLVENTETEAVDKKEYIEVQVADEVSFEQDVPNVTQSVEDNQRVSSENLQLKETLVEINTEIEAVDKKEEYIEVQVPNEVSFEQDVPNRTQLVEDNQRVSSENLQHKETLVENSNNEGIIGDNVQLSVDNIIQTSKCESAISEEIVVHCDNAVNSNNLEKESIENIDTSSHLYRNKGGEASVETTEQPQYLEAEDNENHSSDIDEISSTYNNYPDSVEDLQETKDEPEYALNLSIPKHDKTSNNIPSVKQSDVVPQSIQTTKPSTSNQAQNPSVNELSFSIENMLKSSSKTHPKEKFCSIQTDQVVTPSTSGSFHQVNTENIPQQEINTVLEGTHKRRDIFKHPGQLHKDKESRKNKSKSREKEEISRDKKKKGNGTPKTDKPCKVIVERVCSYEELAGGEPINPCINYCSAPIYPISTELIPYRYGVYGTVIPTAEHIIRNNNLFNPELSANGASYINNSHPVVENTLRSNSFIPEVESRVTVNTSYDGPNSGQINQLTNSKIPEVTIPTPECSTHPNDNLNSENYIEIVQVEGQNDYDCVSKISESESESLNMSMNEFENDKNDDIKNQECNSDMDIDESIMKEVRQIENRSDSSMSSEIMRDDAELFDNIVGSKTNVDKKLFQSSGAIGNPFYISDDKNIVRNIANATNVDTEERKRSLDIILGLKTPDIQQEDQSSTIDSPLKPHSEMEVLDHKNFKESPCSKQLQEDFIQNKPCEELDSNIETSGKQIVQNINSVENMPMKLSEIASAAISAHGLKNLDIEIKIEMNDNEEVSSHTVTKSDDIGPTKESFPLSNTLFNSSLVQPVLSESFVNKVISQPSSSEGMENLLSTIQNSFSLFSDSGNNLQLPEQSETKNEETSQVDIEEKPILPMNQPETFINRSNLPQSTPMRLPENEQADDTIFNISDEFFNFDFSAVNQSTTDTSFSNSYANPTMASENLQMFFDNPTEFFHYLYNFSAGCEVTVDSSEVEDIAAKPNEFIASELIQEELINSIPPYIADEEFNSNAPTDPMVGGQKELIPDPKQESNLDEAPIPESALSFDEDVIHSYALLLHCDVNSTEQSCTKNELNNLKVSDKQVDHNLAEKTSKSDNASMSQKNIRNSDYATTVDVVNNPSLTTRQSFGIDEKILRVDTKINSGSNQLETKTTPSKTDKVDIQQKDQQTEKKWNTNSKVLSPNTSTDSNKSSKKKIPASKYAPPKKTKNNETNKTKNFSEKVEPKHQEQIVNEKRNKSFNLSIDSDHSLDMPQLLSPTENVLMNRPTKCDSKPEVNEIESTHMLKTPDEFPDNDTIQSVHYNMYDKTKAMKRNAARVKNYCEFYEDDRGSSNRNKKRKVLNKTESSSERQEEPNIHLSSPNMKEKTSERREPFSDYEIPFKRAKIAESSVNDCDTIKSSDLAHSKSKNPYATRDLESEFDRLKNSDLPNAYKPVSSKNTRYTRTDRILRSAQGGGSYHDQIPSTSSQYSYSDRGKREKHRQYPESYREAEEEYRRKYKVPERSRSSHSRSSSYASTSCDRRDSYRYPIQSEAKKRDTRYGRESYKAQPSLEERRRQESHYPRDPHQRTRQKRDGPPEHRPSSSQPQHNSASQQEVEWLKLIDERWPLERNVYPSTS